MSQVNYSESNILKLTQNNTCYTYTVIKEGFYPSNDILCYTSARSNSQFKIPDNYLVQTSWGKGVSRHTVKCEINYVERAPVFKIWFGEDFQASVTSTQSPTNAANSYLQVGFILILYYLHKVIKFSINI